MLVAPTSSVDDLFFDVLDEEQADWLLQTKQPPAHPGDVSGAHDSDLLDLRLGLTGSIILSILDLLTSEGEHVYTRSCDVYLNYTYYINILEDAYGC